LHEGRIETDIRQVIGFPFQIQDGRLNLCSSALLQFIERVPEGAATGGGSTC